MVITVSCPACSSSFPVDSNKIPAKGVNARCSTCGDIFRIEKPPEARVAPVTLPPLPEPEPAPRPAMPEAPSVSHVSSEPERPEPDVGPGLGDIEVAPPPSFPEMPPPSVPEAPVAAEPPPATEPEPAPSTSAEDSGFRFGKRDPTDKAKRLARVLVSDMIMYNAERHVTALEGGTLKQDFEEEIEKSWKEFVEQIGPELANGRGREFWTAALNDILAKGEPLF